MSNDPFSEFSKIFAGEFGRALTNAWQETLTKSFANSFGKTIETNNFGAQNPFTFFQQFLNGFPGGGQSSVGSGTDFLQFGQFIKPYLEMFNAGTDPTQLATQMSRAFRDGFGNFENGMGSWNEIFGQLGHLGTGSDFLNSLQKIFSNQIEEFGASPFSALSGDFGIGEFNHGKTPAALGPSREWQLAFDEVVKAGDRLRTAQTRMQAHTASTLESASKRFWQDLGTGDEELTSVKAVYDYWVNCAEDAYYEIVMTDEYSSDFGEIVNSQADFKVKLTAFIDRFLEMLNIPNRRELNGIIKQLARMEDRLEILEKFEKEQAPDSSEIHEVSELREELADLRQQIRNHEAALGAASEVTLDTGEKSTKPKRKKKSKKASNASESKNKDKKRNAKNSNVRKISKSKTPDFDITNITDSER